MATEYDANLLYIFLDPKHSKVDTFELFRPQLVILVAASNTLADDRRFFELLDIARVSKGHKENFDAQ